MLVTRPSCAPGCSQHFRMGTHLSLKYWSRNNLKKSKRITPHQLPYTSIFSSQTCSVCRQASNEQISAHPQGGSLLPVCVSLTGSLLSPSTQAKILCRVTMLQYSISLSIHHLILTSLFTLWTFLCKMWRSLCLMIQGTEGTVRFLRK